MQIVVPQARLLGGAVSDDGQIGNLTTQDGINLLRIIEYHARKSHMSNDKMTATSWDRFLRFVVLDKGDWSVVEHANASIEMNHDRGIQQEITRHRIASYTIESTRFVNYAKNAEKPARFVYPRSQDAARNPRWERCIQFCENTYRDLIDEDGWTPQEARSVFPLALDSNIDVTENLRSWRHFLLMRTTREAHPQMREFAIPLLAQFKAVVPLLFDDIEPMRTQKHNVHLPR